MQYTLRCILDVEEDVIRDISLSKDSTLQNLHEALVQFFELPKGEMASFYRTNDDWEQGEEIPLVDMSDAGLSNEMKDHKLSDIFKMEDNKLLYVYDFLNMWTFFITLHKISDKKTSNLPDLGFSTGILPEEAPVKTFISDDFSNTFDDEINPDFDDNFDFDEDLDTYY
jgi:hypothetical protein